MCLSDILSIINIILLITNIVCLLYQFMPRLYICRYIIFNMKTHNAETYLGISNNSLLGIYIDEISYSYNKNWINGSNLELKDFRLFGNSDYAILLSESDCTITIKLKHFCIINGKLCKKYELKNQNDLNLRNHSLLQGHIIIDKGL